jgi:NAD(P)-dependent dehydrogenase (short-subunit alcohol dehydrogenase family)
MDTFGLIVCNLPNEASDYGVIIAATRCGATGLLNCTGMDPAAVRQGLERIRQDVQGPFGVKLDIESLRLLPACIETGVRRRGSALRVLIEVSSPDQVARAVEAGCDGVIARGMVLAMQLTPISKAPVWVTGIGPDAVMACRTAGVAGVVIEQPALADPARSLPVIMRIWRHAAERGQALSDASPGTAEAVMLQFQQLMTQFLQTQAAVMTAYLEKTVINTATPEVGDIAAEPAATPAGDYTAVLRQIASELTSYPAAMLSPDAAIEADLGIDSVKRGEILSSFQKLCTPGERQKIQAILDSLTRARTLRSMGECIAAALPNPTEQQTTAEDAHSIPRFVLTVTAKPRRAAKPRYYPGRISIITDDETGVAAGIAEELNRAGERAILLRHNPDTIFGADDLFTTDLTDPQAIESAISMIRQEYGPIGAIIHLLPLRSNWLPAQCGFAQWRELVQLDVRCLYGLARAAEADLRQTGRDGGALFATVTGRGGDFGLHATPSTAPTHFAAADFTKALVPEFPEILCKVVDLDAADPIVILQKKLIEELTSPDETLQVGLPGDRRLTVVMQAEPVNPPAARQIQHDWVILITGGARGITAEVARYLAQQRQPVIILVGASPLPAGPEFPDTDGVTDPARIKAALTARLKASGVLVKPAAVESAYQRLMKDREIRRTLEALRAARSRFEYQPVDVRDQTAFSLLIDRIYRDYGRLDVVIHGASITDDKLIRDKMPESFDRVVDTKADSAFVLSRKLRPESLQCLLFMSSVTMAFGNRGQADYAAANGILNGFASVLAVQWPGRVVAMNWGPWDSPGTISDDVRHQLLSHGVRMIPPAEGAEAALHEIEAGPPYDALVALGDGPWAKTALPAGTRRLQIHAFGGMP